jgi:hypothetical protein
MLQTVRYREILMKKMFWSSHWNICISLLQGFWIFSIFRRWLYSEYRIASLLGNLRNGLCAKFWFPLSSLNPVYQLSFLKPFLIIQRACANRKKTSRRELGASRRRPNAFCYRVVHVTSCPEMSSFFRTQKYGTHCQRQHEVKHIYFLNAWFWNYEGYIGFSNWIRTEFWYCN